MWYLQALGAVAVRALWVGGSLLRALCRAGLARDWVVRLVLDGALVGLALVNLGVAFLFVLVPSLGAGGVVVPLLCSGLTVLLLLLVGGRRFFQFLAKIRQAGTFSQT